MANSIGWQMWQYGRLRAISPSTLRVTLALVGAMALCLWLGRIQAVIPLLLGVIASALAETDDNWRVRLLTQLATLLCFALIIRAVQISLPHPAYLMLVLAAGAFLLTLLGAWGEQYRAIASATLIMALYAALATQPHASRSVAQNQEILLLGGAAWHGLISVVWAATFPKQSIQQNLAGLYDALGIYLDLKSRMFEPVRGIDLEQRRLALALHNGRVVDALNATKESLLKRMNPKHTPDWLLDALHQFFVAQDVHERTSSSHEDYGLLADTFFHSDVLYRCQRVLALLGNGCRTLAMAIGKQAEWSADDAIARSVEDLEAAIAYVETTVPPVSGDIEQRSKRSLRALATNLSAISQELFGVFRKERQRMPADTALQDLQPRTLSQFRDRLRAQLTLSSPLMRHAIRLSVALTAGYSFMVVTDATYGFWILLTIVFVCQPYYGATLTRLAERVGGTTLGLIVGWVLLRLFSDPLTQSAFVVAAAVLFFMYRTTRYTVATAGITIFVLLAFNQVGDGYGLIVPRLMDTLAGSLIAGVSVWLVLPCWHSLRLPHLAAESLRAQSRYFREIVTQYGDAGKHDNLAYRIARRNAHNADAALSSALTAAFKEPGYIRHNIDAGQRFLVLSHTFLNYLSALGAHRNAQPANVADVSSVAACLNTALETLAGALDARQTVSEAELRAETVGLHQLVERVPDSDISEPEPHRILRTQLALALNLLPSLRLGASELVSPG